MRLSNVTVNQSRKQLIRRNINYNASDIEVIGLQEFFVIVLIVVIVVVIVLAVAVVVGVVRTIHQTNYVPEVGLVAACRPYGDISYCPKLAYVVQMLVLQPEVVPREPSSDLLVRRIDKRLDRLAYRRSSHLRHSIRIIYFITVQSTWSRLKHRG